MPGRHQQHPPLRAGLRWIAGAVSLAIVGASAGAAIILASAGPASAAPNPSYHPGADPAQFTVTGVVDGNCTVSTGGTEVWIKPGDKINFSSSLVGVNLPVVENLLGALGGSLVGLNVTATVDAHTTHAQTIKVVGGKTTVFGNAAKLSGGNHTLAWTATSVAALSALGTPVNLPLSNAALKSGASLSWAGVIHVTNDTAKCKIGVGTPTVGVSVGPIKVTVPPINIGIPAPTLPSLPKLPKLPGGGKTTAGGGGKTGGKYSPPPLTIPEQVMGGIGGGGGTGGGVLPDAGGTTQLGTGLSDAPANNPAAPRSGSSAAASAPKTSTKRIDLAANKAPAAQLPVLLAIIAIIALSLVTATYARLFLLRRNMA